MLRGIEYAAPPSVTSAIALWGRPDDVRFSPSNRQLAIAGFTRSRISVFDVDITSSRGKTRIALTGGVELASPVLQYPHGLDFIDDHTLITTSRGTDVAVFEIPPGEVHVPIHDVSPLTRCHMA
jgi:hypothetical protein